MGRRDLAWARNLRIRRIGWRRSSRLSACSLWLWARGWGMTPAPGGLPPRRSRSHSVRCIVHRRGGHPDYHSESYPGCSSPENFLRSLPRYPACRERSYVLGHVPDHPVRNPAHHPARCGDRDSSGHLRDHEVHCLPYHDRSHAASHGQYPCPCGSRRGRRAASWQSGGCSSQRMTKPQAPTTIQARMREWRRRAPIFDWRLQTADCRVWAARSVCSWVHRWLASPLSECIMSGQQ